jgi:uncharacterized protein
MAFQQTIDTLRALESDLRADGICGLHLFGSVVRGDSNLTSDIDVMFDIAPSARFSLFDQARVARQLAEALQTKVDFVPRRSLHPLISARAEAERVTIFGE